ncbi:MAG: phage tail tape measure protein [Niallia sp.]
MSDGQIIIDTSIDQSGADNGLKDLQKKMEESAKKMKDIGEGMSKYVTLPLTAVGGAAIKVASDFDETVKKIQSGLGVTEDEALQLNDTVRNVWKQGFGEDMNEVSDALMKVKRNMQEVKDGAELEEVTKNALALGKTFDADVNEITRAGSNLMKNFGIDSTEAFDLMANGAQNGLDFSQEMFDNLSEYSPLFAKMGYSAEDYFAMLQKGSQAGVYNLDYINDVFKEFQIRVKDGSKSTSDAMSQLSDGTNKVWKDFLNGKGTVKDVSDAVLSELKGMDDQVAANNIGVGLFGTKWEDLEADAMYAMGNVKGELKDVDGAMSDLADNQEQSFSQRLASTWREVQDALLPLGQTLLDLADTALPYIEKAVASLSKWFSGLSDNGKMMVVVIGGILAAIGPVLVVLGTIISAISTLLPILKVAWTWFSKLSAIFKYIRIVLVALTSPIGLIAIAVIALAILIYKYWDEIKEYTIIAWNATIEFLKNAWERIKETASAVWQAIIDFIIAKLDAMSLFISTIMDNIKVLIDNAWNWISEKFMTVLQSIAETLGLNFEAIRNNVQTVMDTIKQTIDTIWYFIKQTFTNALNFIKALVTGDFQKAKEIIKSQMDLIKETIGYIWSDIKEVFWNIIDAIKTLVRNKFNDIKNGIKEKMDAAKETISNIWDEIMNFFEGIDLWQTGKDIIQGLIDGVGSMASSLVKKVTSVVGGVKDTITGLFNIHSPSRWMRDMIGKNMILGWEIGIDKEKSNVMNKADEMATWMSPTMPNLSSLLPDVTSSVPSTTNNNTSVTNNSPVQVELNYSGSASLEEVRKMASVLSEEIDKMTKRKARQGGVIFAN